MRLALLSVLLVPFAAFADPSKPNVIVLLAADLGYGDLGCFGHPKIKTPHLDRLAADGIKLTSCYAGQSVCSPSRAVLLTGRERFALYDLRADAGERHDLSGDPKQADRLGAMAGDVGGGEGESVRRDSLRTIFCNITLDYFEEKRNIYYTNRPITPPRAFGWPFQDVILCASQDMGCSRSVIRGLR